MMGTWAVLLQAVLLLVCGVNGRSLKQQQVGTGEISVGIVCAYYKEFYAIFPLMSNAKNETAGGRLYLLGSIGDTSVVLTISGEGVVNSAMTTQAMIDRYSPTHMLFAGVSVGLGGGAQRNDVVIPTKWANAGRQRMAPPLPADNGLESDDFYVLSYDVDSPNTFVRDNNTIASMTLPMDGCLPPPDEEAVTNITSTGGEVVNHFGIPLYTNLFSSADGQDAFRDRDDTDVLWFDADPFLLDVATTMVSNENVTFNSTCVNKYTGLVTQLPYTPTIKVLAEGGLSVDQYIANTDYAKTLNAIFQGEVFDMESAPFMQACASNQQPCMVIRSLPNDITDLASANCAVTAFQNLQTTMQLFFKYYAS